MATTGLYSQHLNNRKVLHLRNAIIAIVLITASRGRKNSLSSES